MIVNNHDPRGGIKDDGLPDDVMDRTDEDLLAEIKEIKHLATVHEFLTKQIAPAKPKTIVMLAMENSKKHAFSFLGPIPFIRRMMVATLISLFILISASLSPDVSEETIVAGLLNSSGLTLLLNLVFILAAVALGGVFYALFQANKYFSQGTFDPKYEPTYWTRFVLGLVFGMILSELLHIDPKNMEAISSSQALVKPTLAILGGFSNGAVYRILNRMVEAVESLVQGNIDQEVYNVLKISSMQMEQEASDIQLKLAMHLIDLQQIHDSGDMSSEDMNKKLKQILIEFLLKKSQKMDKNTVQYWLENLKLQKHPEGGYFKEVYRSKELLTQDNLPARFSGDRNIATSIYFMLTGTEFSAFHRIKSDEGWYFQAGNSSLTIYEIRTDGQLVTHFLGQNLEQGEQLQVFIEAESWFAANVNDKRPGAFVLVGCVVAPAFDFADFELAKKEDLVSKYPNYQEIITKYTI